jgi:dihydropteroate synthase
LAIHRKIRYWKLRSTELQLGEKTVLMGVLNVTPDSFSDGGKYLDPDRAYARALQMEEEGADIIDIGAESTRPDSKRISADEEWQRLVPVLKRLRDKLHIPLSIDTYKSEIAERALDYGVEIVNDPSGLTFDPNIAKVAAQANAALILNHMRGTPETWSRLAPIPDVMGAVVRELDAMASRARLAGVEKNRIALDPGLGFGKRKEQNSEVLAHLGRLVALDYPVMVGASRKAFLLALAETEPGYATAGAVAAAILNGADIVRVHDVKAMKAVALVVDEVSRTGAAAARLVDLESDKAADAAAAKMKRPKKDWLEPDRRQPMRAPLAKAEPVEAPKFEAPKVVPEQVADAVSAEATSLDAVSTGDAIEKPVIAAGEPVVRQASDDTPDQNETPDEKTADVDAARASADETKEPAPATVEGGDRPVPRVYNKPQGDKPAWQRDRPQGDRPQGDRPSYGARPPQGDRPSYGARPQGDRPSYGARPQGDRPSYGARPQGDRPSYGARPQGDRPSYGARPQGDRPSYGGDRPRSGGDRPQGDRPAYGGDRPRYGGDRPQGDRPSYGGDKPRYGGDRPQGDRPRYGGDRPGGDGPPRRFNNDGPPQRSFGDRPRPQGDRPQFRPQGDRPPFRPQGDRPQGDRPPFRPQGDRPSYGGPPRGDGPPRRFDNDRPGGFKPGGYQGGRPDGPPRSGGGDRPGGGGEWKDRGPRPGGDSRPPRSDGGSRPPGGGGRPPFGDKNRPPNRPFRKRP